MRATKLIINGEEQLLSKVISVNGQEGDVTINDVRVSNIAPSSPTEGMVWYDTVNDVLNVYDGTQWNAIDTNTTYTAGNGISIINNEIRADTTVLATKNDLNSKQDTLISGTNIKTINNNSLLGSGDITLNDVKISATAPSSPIEGMVWYDTTNNQLKVYDGTNWNVTGKEYNAGEGIGIGIVQDYSAMQGPAPSGYHVPQSSEWVDLCEILTTTFSMASDATTMGTYLKIPMAGRRNRSSSSVDDTDSIGYYWSSTAYSAGNVYNLYFDSTSLYPQYLLYRSYGFSLRCFKDSPTIPTSSRTTLFDGSGIATGAGIFHNTTDGLISISPDGVNWITIQDKNLGATTVYNDGDTLSEANCGYYYQWGNNYGFAWTGNVTTSSTKVDTSGYGPGNYYSSNTFITVSLSPYDWSSVQNDNLRGGETGVVIINNAITNTGVLSVNGQTGDVTISTPEESNTKTFYLSSTSDLTTAQAIYDWYNAGKNPIIVYNNDVYVCKGRGLPTQLAFWSATGTISNNGYEIPIIYLKVVMDMVSHINLGTEAIPTGIQNDTTGTTTTVTKIRAGTEAEYNALSTHDTSTIYHIY